jgi:iron(III) transport system ATP-binding protein
MISLTNVTKVFPTPDGDVSAVKDLSFTVANGAFFTLLGPSGCGKTTTLRMIAGLEIPTAGKIAIGDQTVFSKARSVFVPAHKRAISMVFQSYAIWPHMSVRDNVAYPLKVRKVARDERRERVEAVLRLVGLENVGSRSATRLSGGQQQRVALARALVAEPDVLLLDEPLSNLDAKLRSQMREELKALQNRLGVTTIYVTHDQHEALAMSDEVCVLDAGRVAQQGTPEDIYHQPRNRFSAEFIGNTNLIAGSASGPVRRGLNTFDTPIGSVTANAADDLPPGQRDVVIVIRPEAIDMKPVGAAEHAVAQDSSRYEGVIRRLVFFGEHSDCTVDVSGHELRVRSLAIRPLPIGTAVSLLVPHQRCTVLTEEVVDGSSL